MRVLKITQSTGTFVVTDLLQPPAVTRVVLAATTPFTLCPSAIDTVLGGIARLRRVPPTGSLGACGLNIPAAHSIDLGMGTGADEIAVGGVRLAPALNGYGIVALATSFGVYAIDERQLHSGSTVAVARSRMCAAPISTATAISMSSRRRSGSMTSICSIATSRRRWARTSSSSATTRSRTRVT